MSAYLCNEQTFGLLAQFAIETECTKYGPLYGSGLDTTDKVVEVLVQANLKSLENRYPDDPAESPAFLVACKKEATRLWNVAPMDILKSCTCLEYQSCEFNGWYDSLAYKVLDCIKNAAIRKLPGYEDAQWGYTTDNPPPIVTKMSELGGRSPQPGEVISLFS